MKHIFTAIAALFFVGSLSAQELVHDANAEVRNVAAFNGIEVSGAITVYLSQGSTQGVAVSTDDEKNISKVKTEVNNGILKISIDGGVWNKWSWGAKKVKAYITYTQLKQIEASGASLISISGEAGFKDVKMEVSGASEIKGRIKGENVRLEVSGASNANLSGTADKLNLEVSGASNFKSFEFTADELKAEASGASTVRITVKSTMKAEASGASSIFYKGSPTNIQTDASGASSIKKRTED
jgi:hypothetical protein